VLAGRDECVSDAERGVFVRLRDLPRQVYALRNAQIRCALPDSRCIRTIADDQ
jgi:hypothetical protein